MEIKIKRLTDDAVLPHRATAGAVAYDLTAPRDFMLHFGRNIIPTDLAIALPVNYEAQVRPRSGFSAKGFEGYEFVVDRNGNVITSANPGRYNADVLIGTIDSDYRGNIGVIVNNADSDFLIRKGTRIAQLVVNKVELPVFVTADMLDDTGRGEGGFGHTGTI